MGHGHSNLAPLNLRQRKAAVDSVPSRRRAATRGRRSQDLPGRGLRKLMQLNLRRRRVAADTARLRRPAAMLVQRNRVLRVRGRSSAALNLLRLRAAADSVRSTRRQAVRLRVASRTRIRPAAAAAVIGIAPRQARVGKVTTAATPMAPNVVHPVRSSICASRSHVLRTVMDIRAATQADMVATVLHRQATVDRMEHRAMVVLVEQLVPAAEVVPTAAAVVMLRVEADIRPVEVVDTLAVAAVDTPVGVAVDTRAVADIPAVIVKTKRRCEQGLASFMS